MLMQQPAYPIGAANDKDADQRASESTEKDIRHIARLPREIDRQEKGAVADQRTGNNRRHGTRQQQGHQPGHAKFRQQHFNDKKNAGDRTVKNRGDGGGGATADQQVTTHPIDIKEPAAIGADFVGHGPDHDRGHVE